MTARRSRVVACAALLALAHLPACRDSNPVETIDVSLANTETYQYPTVGGDEEEARISSQAKHYSVSEIRRGAETNWVATYVYQPVAGFVGLDDVALEIASGSDGPARRRASRGS